MTRQLAIALLCAVMTLSASPEPRAQTKLNGTQKMKQFSPHPGTIRMIDEGDGSVRMAHAENTPERHRFVYLDKDGREVEAAAGAVERVPIVEVRMTPTDGNGRVVPKDRAQLIRIREFGPEGRLLRSTTMTANMPPVQQ